MSVASSKKGQGTTGTGIGSEASLNGVRELARLLASLQQDGIRKTAAMLAKLSPQERAKSEEYDKELGNIYAGRDRRIPYRNERRRRWGATHL